MRLKLGRVRFDAADASVTLLGVFVGSVLTLVCAALSYHFFILAPGILDLNPHNRGLTVGFVQAPVDIDRQRGPVSWTAVLERSHVWREDIRLPPLNVGDRIRVRLVYWAGGGTVQKIWEKRFTFARDPAGVYISLSHVREVMLYSRNDQGELYPMDTAVVVVPVPREYFAPPLPNPPPSPTPEQKSDDGPRLS